MTREFINSIPKRIDENSCWIPNSVPAKDGYSLIMIKYKHYRLSRLTVSIYYDLKYEDSKWDTRHAKDCNKRCFNPEHLQPGTQGDNNRDMIKHGTHWQSKKKCCPKCGSTYRIYWERNKIHRRCLNCMSKNKAKRRIIRGNT